MSKKLLQSTSGQIYYEVWQKFITKCDKNLIQSALGIAKDILYYMDCAPKFYIFFSFIEY